LTIVYLSNILYEMNIVPDPLIFEWDLGNIDKNLIKHKVTNQEAEEIFINESLFTTEDIIHSVKEKRLNALGQTSNGRKLFLTFTIRNNKIRIISVRDMDRGERNNYEKI